MAFNPEKPTIEIQPNLEMPAQDLEAGQKSIEEEQPQEVFEVLGNLKRQEETLSAPENNPKANRLKKALLSLTAGLILFNASPDFARAGEKPTKEGQKTEMQTEEQKTEEIRQLEEEIRTLQEKKAQLEKEKKFQPKIGEKLKHKFAGTPDAAITEIKDDGIVILTTEYEEEMQLRPTNSIGVYEFDEGGSKLPDGAIDISKGEMDIIYKYGNIDKEIEKFSKFLNQESQNLINKTSFENRNFDFYKKIKNELDSIDKLQMTKLDDAHIKIELIDNQGNEATETITIPKDCEIEEEYNDWNGNTSIRIKKGGGVETNCDLFVSRGNIVVDIFLGDTSLSLQDLLKK